MRYRQYRGNRRYRGYSETGKTAIHGIQEYTNISRTQDIFLINDFHDYNINYELYIIDN